MWTSPLDNHTPQHELSLPHQPDVFVATPRASLTPDVERAAAARAQAQGQRPKAPVIQGACHRDRPGAARQRFGFDAALVGAHTPLAPAVPGGSWERGAHEVDVGTL